MPARHILVVEDDETVRKALVDYLGQRCQVEAASARDGVDALHQVLTQRYDVVLLDMMMPNMSGGDFLDSLKAMMSDPSLNFQGSPPAVIVMTGAACEDLPTDVIEHRFPDLVRRVFRKPVDYEILTVAVEAELKAR